MQTALKPQPFLSQVLDLTLIQLTNWRWSWRGMLITGMLYPLVSTVGLGLFARSSGPETLAYILTGNLMLALMFDTMSKVSGNFIFMRTYGMLDYFATLPIRRVALILATVMAFLLLSLPAVLVTMLAGAWFLGLALTPHPLVVVVIVIVALSLAGIGALTGTLARSLEEGSSLTLLVTLVMLGLGPVIVPPDRLPAALVRLGWLSPATYAASALRQALLGPVTARIWLDLAVLGAVSLATLLLASRGMTWRQGR